MPHLSETDIRPDAEKLTLAEFYDLFPTVAVLVEHIADTQTGSTVLVPDQGWKTPATALEIMLSEALEDPDFEERMHRAQDIARRAANRGALTEALQELREAGVDGGEIAGLEMIFAERQEPAGLVNAVVTAVFDGDTTLVEQIAADTERRKALVAWVQEQG